MKIGILTVPFNNNYGGFLQAFALKHLLVRMGHEVIFINRQRNKKIPSFKYRVLVFPYYYIKNLRAKYRQNIISKYTNVFKKHYLEPFTEEYFSTTKLKECLKYKFDAVVVGSDQVWRYKYAKDSIDDFFCDFLEGTEIKHIAYAASIGTDEQEYPEDKLKRCSDLLKSFSAISVRETGGKNLLVRDFGMLDSEVSVVLDPTLLLSKDVYVELFKDYAQDKTKYIFTYVLDKNEAKKTLIKNVCDKIGLMEVSMSAQTGNVSEVDHIEPVELWLSRLYHSDFVVTDSFHGAVFSILFNKPFLVMGNSERGSSRFDCLLNTFELKNRYIEDLNSDVKSIIDAEIDWENVNQLISHNAKSSYEFLKSNL